MRRFHKVFQMEEKGNTLVVCPLGDALGFRYLDVHNETNAVLRELDNQHLSNLVIDFGGKELFGSIIIGSIIKMARKAGQNGGQVAFCNASPEMMEALETMNLWKLWPYFATGTEAMASFGS